MHICIRFPTVLGLLAVSALASAASTVRLSPSACLSGDAIFSDGFETDAAIRGDVTRSVNVPGFGTRNYYLHVPPAYTPARAWPVLLALRGQSVPSATAWAAQQVRNDWSSWADSGGFIVVAPVGNSTQGGWGANGDIEEIEADLDDAATAYDVEQSRIYLWGFSAGAHFAHGLALDNPDYFAAYGVSAGALAQYACDVPQAPSCASLLSGAQPKIPVDIHLGNSDPLYLSYGAGNDPTRFQAGGWVSGQNLFYTLFVGGHTYTVAQLGEIWNHLCPFALGL